jgi:hypothetical protein
MLLAFKELTPCLATRFKAYKGLLALLQQHQAASNLLPNSSAQHAVCKLYSSVQSLLLQQPWGYQSSGSVHTDARLPLERLQESITPAVCAELDAKVWNREAQC